MFRNFGKVFSFSLHNQAGSKSYKIFTITLSLILLVVPIIVMALVAGKDGEEEEQRIEGCGAEMIYIVSDYEATPNLLLLNEITEENYKDIRYKNADSVEAALEAAAKQKNAFVLHFYPEDEYTRVDIILPETNGQEEAGIDSDTAKNFYDFKVEDFEIQGYEYNHEIKLGKIPVAE